MVTLLTEIKENLYVRAELVWRRGTRTAAWEILYYLSSGGQIEI
jgi:hypothetical protein